MVLLVAGSALFQILWRDLVSSAGGLGWDGYFYARIIQYPESLRQIIPELVERVQRILPSLLLSGALSLFRINKNDPNIILSFQIFNSLLLIVDVLLYIAISKEFALKRATRWLGFFPLFFCFGTAKAPYFIPVSTDTAAFTLALCGVFFALKRNLPALLFILLCSAFTWSTLVYWFIPLLIFPLQKTELSANHARPNVVLALTVSLVYLLGVYISYNVLGYRLTPYGTPVMEGLLPVSEGVGMIYLYVAFYFLTQQLGLEQLKREIKQFSLKGILFAVLALVIVRLVLFFVLQSQPGIPFIAIFKNQNSIFVRSIVAPGIFLVSHAVYFGPMFLLMIFLWKDICRQASQLGLGAILFLAVTVFFSITSESRHLLHAYPFLTLLCLRAIEERRLQKILLPVIAIGTLISSKIWWRISVDMHQEYLQTGFLIDPLQRYFMHIGPWMTIRHYAIQGSIALIFGAVLYLLVRRRRTAGVTA